MKGAIAPLSLVVFACASTPESTPSKAVVEAKAIECGLSRENVKQKIGPDGKVSWMIVPGPDGTLPPFEGLKCLTTWGMEQRGFRIGFISEPPR